mgnify:CR=1 FL=1
MAENKHGFDPRQEFTMGGIAWTVIQAGADWVKCITSDCVAKGAFDTGNKNNFSASSLRYYLNGEFLNRLIQAGAPEEMFEDFIIDLTADDGLKDYGGDRQDGEMLFVLHAGNGRAFTKLGSRRRGILQSALRARDRQVGSKGFRGSAGRVSDCFTYPSADRHGIFPRLHLRKGGNPLRARAATVYGRRRVRYRSRALSVNGGRL